MQQIAKIAEGTVGSTAPGTPPMAARRNEQIEAPYEDGVKTRLDELKRNRGSPSTAASGS